MEIPCISPIFWGHRRPRRAFLAGKVGRGFEVLEARALLSIDSSLDGSSLLAVTASPSATPSAYSVPAITLTTPFATDNTAATVRNPQSKVWQHGSDWFAVLDGPALGSDPAGTYVWKLVGTTWVQGPIVINKELLADVKPVGNADTVYAALYGGSKIQLVKLEYRTSFGGNNNYNNYILTSTTSVTLSSGGTDTATIDIDSRGHMWVAYDTSSTVEVRYSLAAPYTTWSAPVVLANTSSSDRDITSVIAFGDKIGVMWSNHSTEEWGFRYHNDTDDADASQLTTWSANERPGATTDPTHNHNVGNGMADDHLNLKAGSDGTVYAAIKTAYDAGTKANPEHALLVRSPNGTWGPVYGIDGNGTRQIVELNETDGFLRYIYGGETGINDIVYKDIPLSAIDPNQPDKFYSGHDFANPAYPRQTLIGGGTKKMVSSTKQSFGSTLVVVATRGSGTPYTTSEGSAPFFIVGAILTDSGVPSANLPPVNTVPGTQTTLEEIPLAFSTAGGNRISISDPDAGAANVRVTLTITGGTAAIGTSGLTITGNGTTSIVATGSITNLNAALGSLVFTPTLNSNTAGSINILTDDLGNTGSGGSQTDSDTVTINITPVNDAPSFVKGADQTVLEDSGAKTVTNWATAASAGPANESAQTLTYSATNNNPTLFSVQPAVAANGTLTFTPAANAFGTATVSVTLTDSGGTANGGVNSFLQTFVITVASPALNNAPSLNSFGNLTLNPIQATPNINQGTLISALIASVPGLITDPDAGSLQGIAVTATDCTPGDWQFSTDGGGNWSSFGDLTSFSRLLAADANTRVRFLPNAGFSGTVPGGMTFLAWDQTAGNNGDALSTSVTGGSTAFSSASRTASINVVAGSPTYVTSAGQATSKYNDEGRAIAVDSAGNVFVAGTFYFSDDGSDSPGGSTADIYLAKINSTGAIVWQQIIGADGDDRAEAIACDTAGNLYITGEFQGTVDFDAGGGVSTLSTTAPAAIFVLKIDANGVFQWVRGYSATTGLSVGYGIAVDTAGEVVVTGQFAGTVDFNPGSAAVNLTSAGGTDIVVLKLNAAGDLQWASGFGGSNDDRGVAIATDSSNRVYVTGAFAKAIDFDSGPGLAKLTSAGGTDAFVLRLNADGTFSFADRFGGSSADEGLGLAVDAAGNIYASGSFKGSGDFNPSATSAATLASAGSYDAFITKLSPNNDFLWANRVGGSGEDRARGVAVLPDGSVSITGFFSGTVDFDAVSGTTALSALGSRDVFVSRLSTNGEFVGAMRFGGTSADFGRGIAADVEGALYITGRYSGAAAFDTGAGTVNLKAVKGDDIFIAKIVPPGGAVPPPIMMASAAPSAALATDSAVASLYTTEASATSPHSDQALANMPITKGLTAQIMRMPRAARLPVVRTAKIAHEWIAKMASAWEVGTQRRG